MSQAVGETQHPRMHLHPGVLCLGQRSCYGVIDDVAVASLKLVPSTGVVTPKKPAYVLKLVTVATPGWSPHALLKVPTPERSGMSSVYVAAPPRYVRVAVMVHERALACCE